MWENRWTIEYWEFDVAELVEVDFSRYVKSLDYQKPEFGYKCPAVFGDGLGIFAMIGADHGAGKSRYLIWLNYESSTVRRQMSNKIDYGTRTLQIAEVSCKRDVLEVQKN